MQKDQIFSLIESAIDANPLINSGGSSADNFVIKSELAICLKSLADFFPQLDWSIICSQVASLKIEHTTNLLQANVPMQYIPSANSIRVNTQILRATGIIKTIPTYITGKCELNRVKGNKAVFSTTSLRFLQAREQTYDTSYLLTCELLRMITSNGLDCSFGRNSALGQGIREIIATNVVGNMGTINNPSDEYLAVNQLGHIIGCDVLIQSFFTGNRNLIAESWLNQGLPASDLTQILGKMDYNYPTRLATKKSNIAPIQKDISADFAKTSGGNTPSYKRNVAGNKNLLPGGITADKIETVYPEVVRQTQKKTGKPPLPVIEVSPDSYHVR